MTKQLPLGDIPEPAAPAPEPAKREKTPMCPDCNLPHLPAAAGEPSLCLATAQRAMLSLLMKIGTAANCSGCGQPVFWVSYQHPVEPRRVNVPYTRHGLNHFVDCPKRETFRR